MKSQKAADRVMEKVSQFIEKKLKLMVNQEKSQVVDSSKVKFLGFTVVSGTLAIAHKALQTAMDKVKALTPRGTHNSLETTLDKINQFSNARAVTRAYPTSWFINLKGQEIRSDRKLAHWFEVPQWIRLA